MSVVREGVGGILFEFVNVDVFLVTADVVDGFVVVGRANGFGYAEGIPYFKSCFL
jgi:hypothetical protein